MLATRAPNGCLPCFRLQAFGPFGKHEGKAVARLAALYGCRASLQGSKASKKLVVVSRRWLVAHEFAVVFGRRGICGAAGNARPVLQGSRAGKKLVVVSREVGDSVLKWLLVVSRQRSRQRR